MLQLRLVATALLAATAAAASVVPRASCDADTTSIDGVQALLGSDQSPSEALEKYLSKLSGKEYGWLNNLWNYIFPEKGSLSPVVGCGSIGGDCSPPTKCSDYHSREDYWIYQSVLSLHNKLTTVYGRLMSPDLLNDLKVDRIENGFGPGPTPDQSWKEWVIAAFKTYDNAEEGSGSISPMLASLPPGIFQMGNTAEGTPSVDTTSVWTAMGGIFQGAGNQVENMLKTATGNGNTADIPAELTKMAPNLSFGTSKFFANGGILYDENKDKASFNAAFDNSLGLVVSGSPLLSFLSFSLSCVWAIVK